MNEQPIEKFGFLIHDAARLLRRRFEGKAQEFGLSAAQWRGLVRLVKTGPMTQAKLAEILEIEPISVSRLVDRMEQAGWAKRYPDENDRRVNVVHATDEAKKTFASIKSVAHEVFEDSMAGIDDDKRGMLIGMLETIVSNLSQETGACEENFPLKRQAAK